MRNIRETLHGAILSFASKKTFISNTILFIAVGVGIVILYKIVSFQIRPVVETPGTEMKHVPAEVKRALRMTTPVTSRLHVATSAATASISAPIRVPILLYHYVEYVQDKKDTMRQSLNIPPNIFEQQVKTLSDAGYTCMTAKELGEVLDGKMQLPEKPILLTFDDGHWDFDTVVLPILKKYHTKATAYIISGFLGGSDFMTQPQLQDVINSGLVDVGAHTVHHISLKGKVLPLVQYEVSQSKAALEQTYHIHVVSFAYPNGSFDLQAMHVVEEAGFTTAVSTIPGIEQSQEDRFFLYRLRPGYRTGQTLLTYLQQSIFDAY